MKRLAITSTIILLVMVMAPLAFGQGRGMGRGMGQGQGTCYWGDVTAMSDLNLTEEQTTKINALRNTHLKEIKPLQDMLFSKGGELRLLWLQTDPDRDKVMVMQKEIRTLRDQMQDKSTDYRLAILKILTPQQRNKLLSRRGVGFGSGPGGGARGWCGPGMGMLD